jgi:hypothetical protein
MSTRLRSWNAFSISSVHLNTSRLRRAVRGATTVSYPALNLRYLISPRKSRSTQKGRGYDYASMASTLAGSMATPLAEMIWPKYDTVSMPNEHFDRLRASLWS